MILYLIQITGLAGLFRYRYAKANDERVMCGLAAAAGGAVSLFLWDAW